MTRRLPSRIGRQIGPRVVDPLGGLRQTGKGCQLACVQIRSELVRGIAAEQDCTPAQVALAWLLAKGDDIVPIPGTKRVKYLEENAAAASITLSEASKAILEQALSSLPICGERYTVEGMKGVNA